MAEKCRSLNFFLLVCALLSGLLFYGCGGGTGSDPIPVRQLQITGNVNYAAALANILESQESVPEGIRASIPTLNAEVYIESNRAQFSTRTDASGSYILSGVPAGTHIVIARFEGSDGKVYKVRSPEVTVTEKEKTSQAPSLQLKSATTFVSGRILDSAGNPQANKTLTIWGENFRTDENGYFTTPPMPESPPSAPYTIVVDIPAFQTTIITVEFSNNTPFVEQTVVSSTSTNRPPSAFLKAPSYKVSPNGQIFFTATASDPDNDILTYSWTATTGRFSGTANKLTETWTAQPDSGVATISFSVKDSGGLLATASVMITVGTGVSLNTPPSIPGGIITDAQVFLGNTDYQLSVNATDSDGDVLSYSWNAFAGTILPPNTLSTVTWKTPTVTGTTDVQVAVSVNDNRGGIRIETKTLRVTNDPNLPPNQPPLVTITSPVAGSLEKFSDASFAYRGSAIDKDDELADTVIPDEKLTWYESKDGSNKTWAGTGSSLMRTLLPGTYSVTLEARDKYNAVGSQTVQFRVNANPDVTIIAPAGNIERAIGTPITFIASGTDIEDGPLTAGSSFFWRFPPPVGDRNGNNLVIDTLSTGTHIIEVSSRDRLGVYSATQTVQVTIFNKGPEMNIAAPTNFVMRNQPFTVSGSGIDRSASTPIPVEAAKMNWELYLTATETIKTGESVFTHPGLSTSGHYTLTLTGSDAKGVSSSTSILFTVNATPTVTITEPASGTRFDNGELINFKAAVTDDSDGLTIKWFDGATVLNGVNGTSAVVGYNNFSTPSLAFGNRVIRCEITDKFGIASSSTINVLVNTLPVATITYNTALQFATAPANVPVFASNTPDITLTLTANTRAYDTDLVSEVPGANILWFTPQNAIPFATGKTITHSFPVGLATVTVRVYDSLRNDFEDLASSTTHFNFHVWQARLLTAAASSTFIHGNGETLYITASAPGDISVKEYEYIGLLSPSVSPKETYDLIATHSFTAATAGLLYDSKVAALGQIGANSKIYNFANASDPPLIHLNNLSNATITNAISWAAHPSDKTYGYFTTGSNQLFTFNPFNSTTENLITTIEGQTFNGIRNVRYVYGGNPAGVVFVADSGRGRVVRFLDASCSNPRTFPASSPVDIAFTKSYVMTLSTTTKEITVHEITTSENRVMMKIPLGAASNAKSIYCSGKDLFIVDGTGLYVIRSGLADWLKP